MKILLLPCDTRNDFYLRGAAVFFLLNDVRVPVRIASAISFFRGELLRGELFFLVTRLLLTATPWLLLRRARLWSCVEPAIRFPSAFDGALSIICGISSPMSSSSFSSSEKRGPNLRETWTLSSLSVRIEDLSQGLSLLSSRKFELDGRVIIAAHATF